MSEFMALDEMLESEGTEAEENVVYIPLPNTVDVVLCDLLAPDDITPTGFSFNFFDDGDLLLAHNRRRQVEVPGGHRDLLWEGGREHPAVAATRESFEETGAVVSDLRL
ncbi:hypothetical protein HFN89_06955 [Rhizobium laguerreae]|nr:hypothetical protein [Rhizobium laguerreae]